MSELRKKALKYLLYILLGVIIIISVANNTGPERYIALFGFLLSLSNLIRIIIVSQALIDDFFPPKGEGQTKFGDKLIYWLNLMLFFGGAVWLIIELKWIDNTIDGLRLSLQFSGLGLLIGIVLILILKVFRASVFYESSRRYSVYFSALLGLAMLTPAVASSVNRNVGAKESECYEYPLVRKNKSNSRSESSYIFLLIDQSEERFEVSNELWDSLDKDDRVEICFYLGQLGYKVVTDFERKSGR